MKTITQLLQDNKVFIVVLSGMFSLVTAFLGFLLGQVSGYFTARKERKKAISIALAELLEVRHQLFAVEEMTEKMTGLLGNVSEQQKSQARVVVTSLLPKWEETHAR